ncbi:response regulator [Blastococcus saxobsidens]|uniref:Response regulator receiver domain-containing protein n=1 Tax=Blastococcus saxobsidens TaxID=138336 RepID=A0A4Q7Y3Y1_9ACTN|nr:response regulator [Blastococcus saxobsidens]RZU30565.1 response regulator receiver domain-containing protein [Blastococcus saxobsidens]
MLTALVVDDETEARTQIAGLLRLGGWEVREAAGAAEALRQSVSSDPDLVVTDVAMPDCSGTAMLHRMRRRGSRARFVVITQDSSAEVREECAAAGVEACLIKPVGPQVLLNFLHDRATGAGVQGRPAPVLEVDDLHDADVEADLADRLRDMYVQALPARLGAIEGATRFGNARAVVAAADVLAGTSGQLGHPDVASVCQAIAADARRGIVAHHRVQELRALAGA